MANREYSHRIGSIKEELSRYSHMSVLNCTLNHLAFKSENSIDEVRMMPWVVMFLLKVSMLGPDGDKEISRQNFHRLANDVFSLQSEAADLGDGGVELKLRAMVLGQMLYQQDTINGLRELFVQGSIFCRADNYYDDLFSSYFGLSLESYLKITMFMVIRLDKQAGNGVVKVPITELLLFLCPGISSQELLAYIRLASCEARHLPGFIESHDLGEVVTSEYFQETPFKYIPFILNGSGLVAFNYRFCITALCTLAPAMLKKNCPAFKDEFGKDMELRVGQFLMGIGFERLLVETELKSYLRRNGYSSNGLKLVDYLVREGDKVTLVECKAIELLALMEN